MVKHAPLYITADMKFGKFRIKDPCTVRPFSPKKVMWVCDCGKEKLVSIKYIIYGIITSCKRCNEISCTDLIDKKFGKLKFKNPQTIMPQSHKKEIFLCDCGRETITNINKVISGSTKSCGKCNQIDKSIIQSNRFGRIKIVNIGDINGLTNGSTRKIECVCDCGKIKLIKLQDLINGHTTSCGHCNEIKACDLTNKKFGKLRLKHPQNLIPGSDKKIEWICDCGNETIVSIYNVLTGRSSSCGKCYEKLNDWYERNSHVLKKLTFPIVNDDIPHDGVILCDTIDKSTHVHTFKCMICKKEYKSTWSSIKNGKTLSCGCVKSKISKSQKEIYDFIHNNNVSDAILEFKLNKLNYDIYVPTSKTLIEYQGLKWHSKSISKGQDIRKYRNAIDSGYQFISIFEDEWRYKKEIMKYILLNRLNVSKCISLRPSKCEIKVISFDESNAFYEKFHYIGKCHSKVSYGVFYDSKLIASISFSNLDLLNKWELLRMASDPEFRVHGIWSKLLKKFIEDHNPSSIIGYSDNRLFTGKTFEKMGFKFNKETEQNYYYVKGCKRLDGLDTFCLLHKIWDLGKKEFVLSINERLV